MYSTLAQKETHLMDETALFAIEVTLSTPDDGGELPTDEWVEAFIQEAFARTELDCLEVGVTGRTGALDVVVSLQIPIADVMPGMEMWNIHDQKWVEVRAVFDNSHEIEVDYGPAVISGEPDHLVFIRK